MFRLRQRQLRVRQGGTVQLREGLPVVREEQEVA